MTKILFAISISDKSENLTTTIADSLNLSLSELFSELDKDRKCKVISRRDSEHHSDEVVIEVK